MYINQIIPIHIPSNAIYYEEHFIIMSHCFLCLTYSNLEKQI